jgi:hypothetical protein
MAYDEGVAQRLREVFAEHANVAEKRMFGGIAFMVSGHMCCGVAGEVLMARVGADHYLDALQRPFAREMDFTGRPMKGFVFVDPKGFETDEDLDSWVSLCLGFVRSLPPK